MTKVSVWHCSDHGEVELIDWTEPLAHCPYCGKGMERSGEYDEK